MNKAKIGLYTEKSLENLPPGFKEKYFQKTGSSYKINNDIKSSVEFKKNRLIKGYNFHQIWIN